MRCAERSGFLFAHSCDREAVASCAGCGKMICHDHLQPGNLCVSCAKRGAVDGVRRQEGAGRVPRDPRHHDDPYWYAGSYYSGYHYYDDRDHRVFDASSAAEGRGFEGDFDAS